MSFFHSVWLVFLLLFSSTSLVTAQSEYHYTYVPKKVYTHQIFSVTLVGPDDKPSFIFDSSSPIQPLFDKPLLVKNGKDTFYTFYFKAGNVPLFLPILFIQSDAQTISLPEHRIRIEKLQGDTFYASVLATDMKIKSQQVSNYDEQNHMVTLSLEAYEANLEDMALNSVKEYGIENLKRKHAKVTAEFYAVLPREQKELSFSYYNTIKKRFITLSVPVEVVNASVTTQSDLNPKVDAFERLKKYTLIAFSLFFVVMFLWKRDFFYLILGVIAIVTLLTFYIPHKKICVKQGSPLYILPTSSSTIGMIIENKLESMLLGERGEYKKIEYKKGIIGWIKNEDICNN
jgi:hypothetical protein